MFSKCFVHFLMFMYLSSQPPIPYGNKHGNARVQNSGFCHELNGVLPDLTLIVLTSASPFGSKLVHAASFNCCSVSIVVSMSRTAERSIGMVMLMSCELFSSEVVCSALLVGTYDEFSPSAEATSSDLVMLSLIIEGMSFSGNPLMAF